MLSPISSNKSNLSANTNPTSLGNSNSNSITKSHKYEIFNTSLKDLEKIFNFKIKLFDTVPTYGCSPSSGLTPLRSTSLYHQQNPILNELDSDLSSKFIEVQRNRKRKFVQQLQAQRSGKRETTPVPVLPSSSPLKRIKLDGGPCSPCSFKTPEGFDKKCFLNDSEFTEYKEERNMLKKEIIDNHYKAFFT